MGKLNGEPKLSKFFPNTRERSQREECLAAAHPQQNRDWGRIRVHWWWRSNRFRLPQTENPWEQVEWWLCRLLSWQECTFNVRKEFEVKELGNQGSKHPENQSQISVEFAYFNVSQSRLESTITAFQVSQLMNCGVPIPIDSTGSIFQSPNSFNLFDRLIY